MTRRCRPPLKMPSPTCRSSRPLSPVPATVPGCRLALSFYRLIPLESGGLEMRKVRWGILSTAKIGLKKVIPAMQRAENCEIVAISSRDAGKAEAAAKALGIPNAYGSYEALLADNDVEAVYVPLPNHMHVAWSIKALEAG